MLVAHTDILISLPLLRFNTVLVCLLPLDYVCLLLIRQETRLSWIIREPPEVKDGHNEGYDRKDYHEPLPLVRFFCGADMRDSKGGEASEDRGKAIALECPADALGGFDPGIEHGHDGHYTAGDAAL